MLYRNNKPVLIFALTILVPAKFRAKFNGNDSVFRTGDFESLSIREKRISLWRKRGGDLGEGPGGLEEGARANVFCVYYT